MYLRPITWKITPIKQLIQSNPHSMWAPPAIDPEDKPTTAKRRTKALRGTDAECFKQAQDQLYLTDAVRGKPQRCYHPSIAFHKALQLACLGREFGKMDALKIVMQGVLIPDDEEFILCDPETMKPLKGDEWQIDFRRAVCHNKEKLQGGVAIVAVRPTWKSWGGLLTMRVDMDMFPAKGKEKLAERLEGLTMLLNIAGGQFGVGVGRLWIKAYQYQKPVWSGGFAGKFAAELVTK